MIKYHCEHCKLRMPPYAKVWKWPGARRRGDVGSWVVNINSSANTVFHAYFEDWASALRYATAVMYERASVFDGLKRS